MTTIDDLIQQLKALYSIKSVRFDTPEYVAFHNTLEEFIYKNHCEKTEAWSNISRNLVYHSSQYMSRQEADYILTQLHRLKRYILAKKNDPILLYLHPQIAKVSQKLYLESNYADAGEDAFKELASRVRKLYVKVCPNQQPPSSDSTLMTTVFSVDKPMLQFCAITDETGKNIQRGYMRILEGVMFALRNPNTHANNSLSKDDCGRQLIFASHLMYKIDDAVAYSKIDECN